MLNFCDFIQVFVFTTNHHLKYVHHLVALNFRTAEPVQSFVCYIYMFLHVLHERSRAVVTLLAKHCVDTTLVEK